MRRSSSNQALRRMGTMNPFRHLPDMDGAVRMDPAEVGWRATLVVSPTVSKGNEGRGDDTANLLPTLTIQHWTAACLPRDKQLV
jgi:hypothetical protein